MTPWRTLAARIAATGQSLADYAVMPDTSTYGCALPRSFPGQRRFHHRPEISQISASRAVAGANMDRQRRARPHHLTETGPGRGADGGCAADHKEVSKGSMPHFLHHLVETSASAAKQAELLPHAWHDSLHPAGAST
jgi:hypothetical protein